MANSQEESSGAETARSRPETLFERSLFELRLVLLVPVVVSLVGSTVMFTVGSYNVYKATTALYLAGATSGEKVILPIVKALDAFLVGIILIIFSFGVYDFFISELDPARHSSIRPDWFKFESTGELKNKLIEVVLVILAIKFFERIISDAGGFTDPVLYLVIPIGTAILAVSIGFFKWATHD